MNNQISDGISVVVPVYNSQDSLQMLINRLEPVLTGCAKEHEIILVNDGSADNSGPVASQLANSNPNVRFIDLMRNYGQHNALLCGIRSARFGIIATIDDDLQNPPEEIPGLLKALIEKDVDVVYGTPQKEQHGFFRDAASIITKFTLQKAMGAEIARMVSSFRVFRSDIRNAFANYSNPYVSIDVLLTWGTTRFHAVKVKHDKREIGSSNYSFYKLVTHALNLTTGFSIWPLQVASIIGFLFTVLGSVLLLFVLIRYMLQGSVVPGFPFLAATITLFSGVQLFVLGVMGEYLARIHTRSMERPVYSIRSDSSGAAE